MVVTVYPGASPERVENEVSDVMESALGTISGVKNVTATSAENYSLLLMEFEDDTDMNSAVVKVSNKVDQTTARYGVFTFGSRLVCIFCTDTRPSIMTMMTATRTVNGFLTLNFSISSYRFCVFPRIARLLFFLRADQRRYPYYTPGSGACKACPEIL